MANLPEPREVLRSTLSQCMLDNPNAVRDRGTDALYLHVGLFSRYVIACIQNIRATLEPVGIQPRAPTKQAISDFAM